MTAADVVGRVDGAARRDGRLRGPNGGGKTSHRRRRSSTTRVFQSSYSACQLALRRAIEGADSGAPSPSSPRKARSKSPWASPCRYSSGRRRLTSSVRRLNGNLSDAKARDDDLSQYLLVEDEAIRIHSEVDGFQHVVPECPIAGGKLGKPQPEHAVF